MRPTVTKRVGKGFEIVLSRKDLNRLSELFTEGEGLNIKYDRMFDAIDRALGEDAK